MDLFDVEAVERVEASIDAFIEKRAREAKDAARVEELWAEQERRHKARRREENRAAWCSYHQHMCELHTALAADHADQRSRLLLEASSSAGEGTGMA